MVQRIELSGKYAVGEHRFALVDDADYGWLAQSAWKAKWNGGHNNIYAVRNVIVNGKNHTIRMHREVFGLPRGDRREIDHKDHNSLNNTRANLRIATRSENVLNSKPRHRIYECKYCGKVCGQGVLTARATVCPDCRKESHAPYKTRATVTVGACAHCGGAMFGKLRRKKYCGDRCRADHRAGRIENRNTTIRSRVLGALNEPFTTIELASKAGCGRRAALRWIQRLIEQGVVATARSRSNRSGGSVYKKV